jgi:ankyrin repeat protein
MAGCEGGQMPIVKRAQELAAQRCTAIAMRHLYGDALYCAATHHHFDIVKALLDGGTDFDLKELSQTVDAVCDWGDAPALRLLLKYDGRKLLGPQQYSHGLDKAARKGKHEVVHFLLGKSFGHHDLTIKAETVIHVSGNDFMSVLRPLIENIRTQESFLSTLNQSLQIASQNGHKEVVDFLIREGADVNAVVEMQHTSQADRLNAYCMFYDRHGSPRKGTALQAALLGFRRFDPQPRHDYLPFSHTSWQSADASSQEQTIQLLLTKRANTNELAGHGRYPLHMAASHCSAEIVQLLIAAGADVNASTQQHGTALQAAACREVGAVPVIKVLLEAGAAISQNDDGIKAALNEALSFFGDGGRFHRKGGDGQFQISNSLTDLLINGPGAAVKILLDCLPEERANDSRYSLLFQMACMAGDRQCVELLLQRRIDVNRSGYYYGTGLQAASRVGNMDIIESLLNAGADVNILQGAHGTALRAAVLGGHEYVVSFLILHGADINLCYKNQDQSILHLALETGNRAIYKILLATGADVNKDMPNQQPIMISASKFGDPTLVELLLAGGADVNIPGKALGHHASVPYGEASPLHAACAGGHESVVQFLLAHGADTEKIVQSSGTPLQAAIRGNHLLVVRLLLDARANVDQGSYDTPLLEASRDGKLEMVEELLKAGACIGDPPTVQNALATACTQRHRAVSELLLEALRGTDKEARICADALSAAMQSRDDEMVQLLLERGLALTIETLHQACAAGLEETVRMLLVNGIDVNSDDGTSAHPLHVAACHSHPTVVQLLIDRGADVNLRSTKYGSPLIAALEGCLAPFLRARSQPEPCKSLAKALPLPGPEYKIHIRRRTESQARPGYKEVSQCEQIVQSLFDHGAEVDIDIRSFGNTLHLASCMGSETIVRHVLKRISDVNVFGGYFGSPLLAALEGDHLVIVKLLLGRGIDVNHPSSEHGTALHYACAHGTTKSVQMLLDHGADVNAYDEKHGSPLAAAVSTGNGTFPRNKNRSLAECHAIVELLLRHGDKVQIRECDLLAAVSCRSSADGEHYMRLFLEHDQSARATEPVFVQAILNFGGYSSRFRTLPRLLERDGGLGTTPTMLKAANEPEVMRMLLEHKPVCELTAEILEAAAKQCSGHFELVKLLLAHNPKIPITEAAVMAALELKYPRGSDGNLLKLLFDCNNELEITEAMLKAAETTPDMKLLLERRRKELPISSEVIEAVASRYCKSGALVRLLLEHDKSIKITPPVVQRAITYYHDSEPLIETLLEHDPTLEIGQEQLLSMIKGHGGREDKRQIVELLVKHGKTLDFTPEISVALDEEYQSHSDKDMKECFSKLERQDTS